MIRIVDFHTHHVDAGADALTSVLPSQFDPQPGRYYSVGIHPWNTVELLDADELSLLERCAQHPQVLAIGETGIDHLRGASLEVQTQIFVQHLHVAARWGKPVVVHSVRSAQGILAAYYSDAGFKGVRLAIHGMRSNEHVARVLIDGGCYLSYGAKFNEKALLITPLDRLLIETDESPMTIDQVADGIAAVLHMSADEVKDVATANAATFLGL